MLPARSPPRRPRGVLPGASFAPDARGPAPRPAPTRSANAITKERADQRLGQRWRDVMDIAHPQGLQPLALHLRHGPVNARPRARRTSRRSQAGRAAADPARRRMSLRWLDERVALRVGERHLIAVPAEGGLKLLDREKRSPRAASAINRRSASSKSPAAYFAIPSCSHRGRRWASSPIRRSSMICASSCASRWEALRTHRLDDHSPHRRRWRAR
jgi:hypothetical protein